jgi:DNA-directed RNA polymerase subunit L
MEPIITVERESRFTRIVSKRLSPATMNAIRRAIVSHVPTIGFQEYIDPEDFDLINEQFSLPNRLSRERHTVTENNTLFSIPVISHRLSRLPVYTTEETVKLLMPANDKERVYLVLADGKDVFKPMCNTDADEIAVSARDLQPVAFKHTGDKWELDRPRMTEISKKLSTIFRLNTFIVSLQYGNRIYAILKPEIGIGLDNPRWTPCVQRYRFNRDPAWNTPLMLHKTVGELNLRKQFATMPPSVCAQLGLPEGSTYDRFLKPYEVELNVIQNGKMDQTEAILTGIDILKTALARFQTVYNDAPIHDGADMEDAIILDKGLIYKDKRLDLQTVYIPLNTHAELDPDDRIFTGHTIGNLLANKMLHILDREIIKDRVELYQKVLIAYKVPHQLIQQCLITIRLPESIKEELKGPGVTAQDILLNMAINELQAELKECATLLV